MAGYSIRLYMYVAIYNRYRTIPGIVPSEIFTLDIRTVFRQTAPEASVQVLLLEYVPIGAQQGVQIVTVWISGNSAVTTK